MNHLSLSSMSLLVVLATGCSAQLREPPAADGVVGTDHDQSVLFPEPPPRPLNESGPQSPAERRSGDDHRLMMQKPASLAAPVAGLPQHDTSGRDRENYAHYEDNPVRRSAEHPLSTFSVDVDTGSYSNVRRILTQGRLPPADAVRAEELLNYFDYGYTQPTARETPFSISTEIAPAPWNPQRHLLLIGLQGYRVAAEAIPAVNLVYLIDTSGSMQGADRIDLLKQGFTLMTRQLRPQDRVAIVTYSGSAGLVLASTPGDRKDEILDSLDRLRAGGSTNGGAGIQLAYAVARENFIPAGVNRVILASDGDFNVGTTGVEALKTLVADQRRSGVGLTVLGFGGGNYNDHLAEQLANNGNGSYHYIDTLAEASRVLVDQLAATVLTIAEDVKIQIEFNPAMIEEYRLVGYENRVLRREDFNNDQVDAGEIGAGHSVTALYEIVLAGSAAAANDPLRYRQAIAVVESSDELALLRLRYKLPGQSRSRLLEQVIEPSQVATRASDRLRFAAAVAGFADALRGGRHLGDWSLAEVAALAADSLGEDRDGYRAEFLDLVARAGSLSAVGGGVAISN